MSFLHYEIVDEGCSILTIHRPEALNALNINLLQELKDFIQESYKKNLRVLIVTGEGDKAFIAGADIKQMVAMSPTEMLNFCELGQNVTNLIENAPFLTIAAINGYALGGGLEMALACDFIYASKKAKLGLPEVTLGIIPGFGGTQRLGRAIGSRLAKELIMTGRLLSAEEALEYKIVNRLCEPEHLIKDVLETAKVVCKYSMFTVSQIKKAINAGMEMHLAEGLELERALCSLCFGTAERLQAMQNFIQKK